MRAPIVLLALSVLVGGCVPDTRGRSHHDAGQQSADGGGCGFLTDCSGVCADLASDHDHCGACELSCAADQACFGGSCSACTPSCEGRACGDDGCGGSCGSCPSGQSCSGGVCGDATAGESCAMPAPITTSGSYPFSFDGRVADHTPLACGNTSGLPDVVFLAIPTTSGTATFETMGDIDTVMAVYSSSTCAMETSLSCDDDGASSGTNSLITLEVSAGTPIYVVIAPYGSVPTGSSTLVVTLP